MNNGPWKLLFLLLAGCSVLPEKGDRLDPDGDGVARAADRDDADGSTGPGAEEVCGDGAGVSLAGAGDVDGDGRDDLRVGASAERHGGEQGRAAVYSAYTPPRSGPSISPPPPGRPMPFPAPDRAALLRALTAQILDARQDAAKRFYIIGAGLARVQDEALWQAARFDSFEDYLRRGVDLSRAWAFRLMRVARQFNADIAARYGVEKLDAALAYLAATPREEAPGDLLSAELRLRGEDGRFTLVPFHDATAAQVREAARLMRDARRGGRRAHDASAMLDRAKRLATALPEAPKGIGRGERVKVQTGEDGRLALSFSAIPVDRLGEFIALLEQVRAELTS